MGGLEKRGERGNEDVFVFLISVQFGDLICVKYNKDKIGGIAGNFCRKSEAQNHQIFIPPTFFLSQLSKNIPTPLQSFTVKPLHSLLSSNQRGHTFNYSCGKFDGEEKGFIPLVPSTIKCNAENTFFFFFLLFFVKMTKDTDLFLNPALRGTFNNYMQICIMNEEPECIFKSLALHSLNLVCVNTRDCVRKHWEYLFGGIKTRC